MRLFHCLRLGSLALLACFSAFAQTPTSYAFAFGTNGEEVVRDSCADSGGSYITAFTFQNTITFPGGGNLSQTLSSNGLADNGLIRYDFLGNLQWAMSWGNQSGVDRPVSVLCSRDGHIYVTGVFEGAMDANPRVGTNTVTSNGSTDVYVIKLTNSGNFVWARTFGGPQADAPTSISISPQGDVVLSMTYRGNMDANPSATETRMIGSVGGQDIAVIRLTAAGAFKSVLSIGGTGDDGANGVSALVNNAGDTIVAGTFAGAIDVDPSVGSSEFISEGGTNAFIGFYTEAGALITARGILGTGDVRLLPTSLQLDALENYYLVGSFRQTIDIDTSGSVRNLVSQSGNYDLFAASYSKIHGLNWSWRVGGILDETPSNVFFDRNGMMVIGGKFRGTFNANPGLGSPYSMLAKAVSGATDAFALKYRITDGSFISAMSLGNSVSGSANQNGIAAAYTDTMGNLVVAGNFFGNAMDFDPSENSQQLRSSAGSSDMFLASYSWRGTLHNPSALVGTPLLRANTNAASFLPGPVVPGGLATIFGMNITTKLPGIITPDIARVTPIPTKLCNTEVIFRDPVSSRTWKAPILFCGASQINYQVPAELPMGFVELQLMVDNVASNDMQVLVQEDEIGLFMENAQTGVGALVFAVGQRQGQKVTPTNTLTACDVVEIYTTGLGTVSPSLPADGVPAGSARSTPGNAKVLIFDDGTQGRLIPVAPRIVELKREDGNILYTGLSPQFVGLYQINMMVPDPRRQDIPVQLLLQQGTYPAQVEYRGRRSERFNITIDYSSVNPSRCGN